MPGVALHPPAPRGRQRGLTASLCPSAGAAARGEPSAEDGADQNHRNAGQAGESWGRQGGSLPGGGSSAVGLTPNSLPAAAGDGVAQGVSGAEQVLGGPAAPAWGGHRSRCALCWPGSRGGARLPPPLPAPRGCGTSRCLVASPLFIAIYHLFIFITYLFFSPAGTSDVFNVSQTSAALSRALGVLPPQPWRWHRSPRDLWAPAGPQGGRERARASGLSPPMSLSCLNSK